GRGDAALAPRAGRRTVPGFRGEGRRLSGVGPIVRPWRITRSNSFPGLLPPTPAAGTPRGQLRPGGRRSSAPPRWRGLARRAAPARPIGGRGVRDLPGGRSPRAPTSEGADAGRREAFDPRGSLSGGRSRKELHATAKVTRGALGSG